MIEKYLIIGAIISLIGMIDELYINKSESTKKSLDYFTSMWFDARFLYPILFIIIVVLWPIQIYTKIKKTFFNK